MNVKNLTKISPGCSFKAQHRSVKILLPLVAWLYWLICPPSSGFNNYTQRMPMSTLFLFSNTSVSLAPPPPGAEINQGFVVVGRTVSEFILF